MEYSKLIELTVQEVEKRQGGGNLLEFIKSPRKKALFGAGGQARICLDFLRQLGFQIEFIIISDESNQAIKIISEVPLRRIADCQDEDREYDILISVNERLNGEIKTLLKKRGFQHIYWSDCWNITNELLRNIIFTYYLKMHIGQYNDQDEIIRYGNFRIRSCTGMSASYSSMLMGEFNDIIAPSIFQDFDVLTEGAYEYSSVKVNSGDVVFDLGANIGMFSCVAASKGGIVYAFEPTPGTIDLLKENQRLYDDFYIEPYAVCDYTGTTRFYCNLSMTEDINTGKNSMIYNNEGFDEIEVKTITIDEFVATNNIPHVDFIKADIEGAERNMLRGAAETLKKFGPKLSLCTYHLPDDKEVLEKLILEANPEYVIEHRWKKLYAYIPQR